MSTEQKHTPGPWEWVTEGESNNGCGRLVASETGEFVMNANEFSTDCMPFIDATNANARLIAAAPELLAACEAVAKSAMRNEAYDLCVAAIAKATGVKGGDIC